MVFDFGWYDGEEPNVVEQLPGGPALVIWGEAVTPADTGGDLAGLFSGSLRMHSTLSVWSPPMAACVSSQHEFLLTRRAN